LNKRTWIILFAIALAANIAGGYFQVAWIDYISKPFVVIALTGYFIFVTFGVPSRQKKWVVGALFFSWVGDILLMFQRKDPLFFLLGLSSFLIAHLFYIVFFHQVRLKEEVKGKAWLLLPVAAYYIALIALLSPHLGEMKLPVRIYGIVISFMLMLALHMVFIRDKTAGRRMLVGALLFIISDSVLAINKFYHTFAFAGTIVMLTYGLAQLLIIKGAARYIILNRKE
jgi:uncharacterized membrane protein YhhN